MASAAYSISDTVAGGWWQRGLAALAPTAGLAGLAVGVIGRLVATSP